jgi:hypothetical protein
MQSSDQAEADEQPANRVAAARHDHGSDGGKAWDEEDLWSEISAAKAVVTQPQPDGHDLKGHRQSPQRPHQPSSAAGPHGHLLLFVPAVQKVPT